MNDPSSSFRETSQDVSASTTHHAPAQSMRSRRATWARPRSSDDGYSRYAIISSIFLLLLSIGCMCCYLDVPLIKFQTSQILGLHSYFVDQWAFAVILC